MFKPLVILALVAIPAAASAQEWRIDLADTRYTQQDPLPLKADYQAVDLKVINPLKLSSASFAASDQPAELMRRRHRDRLSRLSQQQLDAKLAGMDWQSTALETEFRWLSPEAGKSKVSPFVIGGISMTSVNSPAADNNTLASGWRYGGGFAYSWSTELDIKLGYQASAMPNLTQTKLASSSNEDRWQAEIIDVSIAYRF